MVPWDYSMSTGSPIDQTRGSRPSERSHNPRREPVQERVVREIRMLRAMRRELETGLRWLLHGHEEGNLGYSQGAAYGLPRQFPTLPRLSPKARNPSAATRSLSIAAQLLAELETIRSKAPTRLLPDWAVISSHSILIRHTRFARGGPCELASA